MSPIASDPFEGCRFVITGASSGIGRQVAIDLANQGAAGILIHYHSRLAAAQETARSITRCEVAIESCDFADHLQIEAFVERVFQRWTRIDGWIHLAGADVLTGDAAQWDFDLKLRHLIEVDLLGAIVTGRIVGGKLRSQRHAQTDAAPASMVFVSWDQATAGMEGDAGQMFAPVKAAVQAFANSLAQELAPAVRVNTVAPGWIRTQWGQTTSEYWNQRARDQSLMQRWGKPSDVSAAVAYLVNPKSDFITGQTIEINGGWNRRYAKEADPS